MTRVLDPAQIEAFTERAIPRLKLADGATVFAARAARLRRLSEGHAVGDYLRLMATLCDAQQRLLERPGDSAGLDPSPGDGVLEKRLQLAREHGMPPLHARDWPRDSRWRGFLDELCRVMAAAPGFPPAVAETCRRIAAMPVPALEAQADRLLGAPSEGIDLQAAPIVMAALQVYWAQLVRALHAGTLAAQVAPLDVPGICPLCGTLPVASIVRADPVHQGYRYLHCALCDTEWHLVRIKCSQCQSTQGIHYEVIEGVPTAVRAEACDSCRSYRKICYQEQDPEVEPAADDLASLALDLLMAEDGFHRASGHPLLWQAAVSTISTT